MRIDWHTIRQNLRDLIVVPFMDSPGVALTFFAIGFVVGAVVF